jgi:hypothetical protein
MIAKKRFALLLPYLAVWAGLFLFKNAWFTLIGFHISILLALLVLRPDLPVTILFKSNYPKWLLVSILFCSTSGMGLYFLWNIFGIASDLPAQLRAIGLTSKSWPMFIAYFALVNPWIEEYFWRGVLASDEKQLSFMDAIFAGYHALVLWGKVQLLSILFAVIILTSAGWLWRQIARENKGLLAPVLGHMAADLSILLTIYWMST